MYAQHGMLYQQLPSLFMAYDIYLPSRCEFYNPSYSLPLLRECGFSTVPVLDIDPENYEELAEALERQSPYSDDKIEGIYIKVSQGDFVTQRFKMVRPDFIQGALWDQDKLKKNKLV